MKLRNGFVSNSSTASFLVETSSMCGRPAPTKSQVKKLLEYGFKKSTAYYPEQIRWDEKVPAKEKFYNYAYEVICNEDETLKWLVKNKIPFRAECHYGQYNVIYNKDAKVVISLRNNGKCYLMSYSKDQLETPGIKEIPVEQFIKGGNYYI